MTEQRDHPGLEPILLPEGSHVADDLVSNILVQFVFLSVIS